MKITRSYPARVVAYVPFGRVPMFLERCESLSASVQDVPRRLMVRGEAIGRDGTVYFPALGYCHAFDVALNAGRDVVALAKLARIRRV